MRSHLISCDELSLLIGTADAPRILDVRIDDDFNAVPQLIPGSRRYDFRTFQTWRDTLPVGPLVIACHQGLKLSQGVAARLRAIGRDARSLEGGNEKWAGTGHPVVLIAALPERTADGHTLWVTCENPVIDRIACPWLIRRFVEPDAEFLFVAADQVGGVADRFGATPFDVEGVLFSHRGETCTFDTMLEEFGLANIAALARMAEVIRAADTGKPDTTPQAAGLLAISFGMARSCADNLTQMEAGLRVYDHLYQWALHGAGFSHNWPTARIA